MQTFDSYLKGQPGKESSPMNSQEGIALSAYIDDLSFDDEFSSFLAELQDPCNIEFERPIEESDSPQAKAISANGKQSGERRSDVAVEQQRLRDRNRINQARYRERRRVRTADTYSI
jgi:hypothetical protein